MEENNLTSSTKWRVLRYLLPSPGNVLFTLLVVGLLFWVQNAQTSSRTPTGLGLSTELIAYQGRLADSNGDPLTGTYDMTFKLYDSGGSVEWTEVHSGTHAVVVNEGLFNVFLGSLEPIPGGVFTGNNYLTLGVSVGNDPEMMPRVLLGTVPFAKEAFLLPNNIVDTDKIQDEAVTSSKQTVITYYGSHSMYTQINGVTGPVVVSTFQFTDVPAGDVTIILTGMGYREAAGGNSGNISLRVNQTNPTDEIGGGMIQDFNTPFTMIGGFEDFSGGTLTIEFMAEGDDPNTQLRFGIPSNDPRYGRKVIVIAGQ